MGLAERLQEISEELAEGVEVLEPRMSRIPDENEGVLEWFPYCGACVLEAADSRKLQVRPADGGNACVVCDNEINRESEAERQAEYAAEEKAHQEAMKPDELRVRAHKADACWVCDREAWEGSAARHEAVAARLRRVDGKAHQEASAARS